MEWEVEGFFFISIKNHYSFIIINTTLFVSIEKFFIMFVVLVRLKFIGLVNFQLFELNQLLKLAPLMSFWVKMKIASKSLQNLQTDRELIVKLL